MARRHVFRDAGFWFSIVAVIAWTNLWMWTSSKAIVRAIQNPLTLEAALVVGTLLSMPLIACWVVKHRTDAIVARLHRSLPITTCRNCLYDTAGVPTDCCPECGEKFAINPPRATP